MRWTRGSIPEMSCAPLVSIRTVLPQSQSSFMSGKHVSLQERFTAGDFHQRTIKGQNPLNDLRQSHFSCLRKTRTLYRNSVHRRSQKVRRTKTQGNPAQVLSPWIER